MRDQRPVRRGRRRVLSRRGRLTIFVLAGLLAFVAGYAVHDDLGAEWPSTRGLPAVASGPAPAPDVAAAPPPAPDWLIERLPVGTADYAQLVAASGEASGAAPRPIAREISGHRVEYSFDPALTRRVLRILDRGRVARGHVIVLDPRTGRVLAYVATDVDEFPPQHNYPAASLVKVVTAAAALLHQPDAARRPCLYRGNRYRLTRSRVHRPQHGHEASLERALATSNNQCFAQLAVDAIGGSTLIRTIEEFGWLDPPAPGHAAGLIEPPGDDDYDLGRLGCGLSGCRITPLHAAQLGATLATGEQVTPWWVDRVLDEAGRPLRLPERPPPRRVMSAELAEELRSMLVRTTTNGTARSAFRDRRGRPKLGHVRVAGKTGNLTGSEPRGRYEWFVGVAPAERPTIAVAVLQLQSNLWWSKSSELAADVLAEIFCERGRCEAALAERFTGHLPKAAMPVLLSEQHDADRLPSVSTPAE